MTARTRLSAALVAALVALAGCGPAATTSSAPPLLPPGPPEEPAEPVEPADPAPPEAEEPAPTPLAFPEGEEFRKTQPAPGPVPAFRAPSITRFKLRNGIEVFLVERRELPTISMDLTFEGGSIDDPPGKEGLASMCVGLMSDGTEALDKLAFEAALADLASSVSSWAGTDQQGVAMSTLTRHLDATLDLWADTLLRPGMRADELERSRKRRLAGLEQIKSSPAGIAGRLGGSVIYGPDHAHGRFHTEASTKAITLDDCKTYVAERIRPAGARLWVVGDIGRKEIEEKLGARLAEWKGAPRRAARVGKPAPRAGRIFFVDVPGAAQSVVSVLHHGPARRAPDYLPTHIASTVLGGGFSSRINMNIRERHGYAYGAYGGFRYTREGSTFQAGGSIRSDVTREAIVEIFKEIELLRSKGITAEELAREKEGAILGLPAQFATGRQVLSSFRSLLYYGLPLDYYQRFVPSVQRVTLAQANAAARRHLTPDSARILVVGDGKTVLPGLRALLESGEIGKGELVILDADGNEVREAQAAAEEPRGVVGGIHR